MAFELDKVEDLLSSISMELIMISPDNLVDISDILGHAEDLNAAFAPLESEAAGRIIQGLQSGLKAIIRGQVEDVPKALDWIGRGLSLLQDLARSLPAGAPFRGDDLAWAGELERLATAEGLMGGEWAESGPDPKPRKEPAISQDLMPDQGPGLGEVDSDSLQARPRDEEEVSATDERPPQVEDQLPMTSGGCLEEDDSDQPLSLNRFKAEFLGEIEEIQVLLVATEQKNDPQAALSELIRNFRAIVGATTLLELEHLALIAFNSLSLIEYVASDNVSHSTAITDILLKSCDYLLKGLRGLEMNADSCWAVRPSTLDPGEVESFADELWMARQGVLPKAQGRALESSSGAHQPAKPKKIGEILVEKGLISEGDLGGLIQAQQNARKLTLGEILLAEHQISPEDLEEALEEQKLNPERRLGEILVALGKLDYEQIETAIKKQEERRETKLGEFLVKSKIGAPEKVAIALREQKQSEAAHKGVPVVQQTVKVETMKLDGLIDLVGELVIAQSLISSNETINGLKEQKINKDLAHVSRITSELQRNAMSLRMVQIRQTFQKMNRLVRDLAHRFEKDVKFETIGDDTEIDRNMVESIYDPLVHLVRNSLDHGLEPPDERRAKGKSPQGHLSLKAYHQGGNVVIELADDGRGLDREKVLAKARARGLVGENEEPGDAVLHGLVFHPGFSTAQTVSDISGRGVGLDVVKKSIEALRGKVDFTSVPDRGSTMIIRLPLTLAIIDGMIVRVGEHRYILPTISIVESFRPARDDYYTVKGQGEMIKVRKRLLPLVRLDRIVGASGALDNPDEALVVVVENEGESRCLLVDEVLGKQEVVIKSLGERLKYVHTLAGGTILGDGRVGLILDIAGLFEMSGLMGGRGAPAFGGEISADDDWGMNDENWAAETSGEA